MQYPAGPDISERKQDEEKNAFDIKENTNLSTSTEGIYRPIEHYPLKWEVRTPEPWEIS